jgi:hypothetical protein
MSIETITFDHLELDLWHPRSDLSVNPRPFDSMTGIYDPTSGALVFTGRYSQEMAGGLLSVDIPASQYANPTRKFAYSAFNVKQFIPAAPKQPVQRNELDLKETLFAPPLGSLDANGKPTIGNQANVSTQQRPDTGAWQLDPDGKGWVNSGYVPKTAQEGKINVFQIRAWADTKWSVTGLQCNAETAFVPGPNFQNLPLIATTWTAGLHPQLQWEGALAPFAASVYYYRVQIQISEAPIPMLDPNVF